MTTLMNSVVNFKSEFIYLDKSVPIQDPGSLVSSRLCVPSLPLAVPSSPETLVSQPAVSSHLSKLINKVNKENKFKEKFDSLSLKRKYIKNNNASGLQR